MRNHRLRERRLKLGVNQLLVGCLADWRPSNAQPAVSQVELGKAKNPAHYDRVRRAIVWLEMEPRRRRAADREEDRTVDIVEAAILLNRREVIADRLVTLLLDGRGDDFDTLAKRVAPELVDVAGDQYLDLCSPCLPPT